MFPNQIFQMRIHIQGEDIDLPPIAVQTIQKLQREKVEGEAVLAGYQARREPTENESVVITAALTDSLVGFANETNAKARAKIFARDISRVVARKGGGMEVLRLIKDNPKIQAANSLGTLSGSLVSQAALEILEFANSQLLEFRHYDELLDEEMASIYQLLQKPASSTSGSVRGTLAPPARCIDALALSVNAPVHS